ALLEAYCQFIAVPHRPVLLVYGDAPLPDEYRRFASPGDASIPDGRALALLVTRDVSRPTAVSTEASAEAPSPEAQVQAFIRHLEHGGPVSWSAGATSWSWH